MKEEEFEALMQEKTGN